MRVIKLVGHGTATMSSATSTSIVTANASRKAIAIGGHATVGLWLGFGTDAVVGTGFFVPPSVTVQFGENDGTLFQGQIFGKLASGVDQAVGFAEFK